MRNPFKWLKGLWKRRDHLQPYRLKAIEIVNKIKAAVDSEEAVLITKIIPGNTDDKLLIVIRQWLPKILKRLNLASDDVPATSSILTAVHVLKTYEKPYRKGYYLSIAGDIYRQFTDLPLDTAMEEVQKEYTALTSVS